ncbi:MAG: glycoside hydrolase family 95 protein [Bacteroidales bacterium]|nr:glycoside hydrolase family 95 protein [Bacteroidales bacterium]
MERLFFPVILAVFLSGCTKVHNSPCLWYDKPAADWNEALPVGNGRIGAMIFGDPADECIQINEESIWAGSRINNNNPAALSNLPRLQDAIFRGDIRSAEKIAAENFIGTPPRIRSYQPLGELLISYSWDEPVTGYQRRLDLQKGIATTSFSSGGHVYTQMVFASAVDNVIAVKIGAAKGGSINASFELRRERDAEIRLSHNGTIILKGQIIDAPDSLSGPGGGHMRFAGEIRFMIKKGKMNLEGNRLNISEADNILALITAATDYNLDHLDFDRSVHPELVCKTLLDRASAKPWKELLNNHINEHSSMFDRVRLDFGPDSLNLLPVNARLDRIRSGQKDNGLIALYFQYGRYLLMGSSRAPGILPANLQGIWNKDYNAPWNSDFHTNINLQMNYWPAEVCNLPETAVVLAEFIKRITKPGSVTAKEMYGTRGWTMHHLTDPFGRTGVADGLWGLTPTNGPWMTFPLYEHFLFTRDTNYLRNTAYPVIKGSAEFILDFLVTSPEGFLVTNPSTSPENRYYLPVSREVAYLTYSATIDVQTVRAVLEYCSEAAEIIGKDTELVKRIDETIKKLPPVQINSNGTIQEWIRNYEEVEPGHRHMSHLLGLYPLAQITPDEPELFEAAARTIERRLSFGGGHTGWSRAWIINFFARLKNGDEAYSHIISLLDKSTQTNLFDSHPPFQIDGNFGGTAGIAEMIMQSHQGFIELLPALPEAWNEGNVKGLVARGNFIVDMSWKDHRITSARIHSVTGSNCRIMYNGRLVEFNTEAGKDYYPDELLMD